MQEHANVSRRSFITGAGALAAVAAVSLTGCAPKTENTSSNNDEKPKAARKEATITHECDVAVIGLGASGLMAAYGAASKGASVIAIDTSTNMAGTTNVRTSGAWCVGSKLQQVGENPLTIQEAMDHINTGTSKVIPMNTLRVNGCIASSFIEVCSEFHTVFDKSIDSAT